MTGRDEDKMKKSSNKGFTLVEIVAVLVILALLAAIIIPGLTGYIEQARAKKYLPNAKSCLDAAQAMFSGQCGLNGELAAGTPVVSGARKASSSGNEDQDISNTKFAQDILRLAGLPSDKPYCFMVAVGSNAKPKTGYTSYSVTEEDKYTVFYAFYMEDENSKPWYFYNGEWTTKNPRFKDSSDVMNAGNVFVSGPLVGKRLQYYLIVYHGEDYKTETVNSSGFWNWLKSME